MKNNNVKNFFGGAVKLITPKIFKDNRGYFTEAYNSKYFKKNYNINDIFVQDNVSFSKKKNTIRGMHLQTAPYEQAKLIFVLNGSIIDYFVDLRKKSKTFGKFGEIKLQSNKNQFLYISKGFAHGYKTLENNTSILYKVSNFYSPRNELTLNYLDSNIKIDWNSNSKRSLSKKDLNGMSLEEITKYL